MDTSQIPLLDVHLPDAVSWWPPAPGWWLLATVLTIAAGITLRQWRRRPAQSGFAMVSLNAEVWQQWEGLKRREHSAGGATERARELSEFLRRVALSMRPRHEVAGLTSERWLSFLDSAIGGNEFRDGCGHLLVDMPYQSQTDAMHAQKLDACMSLCERWLCAVMKTPSSSGPGV